MDNDLNRSVRLLEDVFNTPDRNLYKKSSFLRLDTELSFTMADYEISEIGKSRKNYEETMQSILDNDKTIIGDLLQKENPWKNAVDNMYLEFFEILQGQSGTQDTLETLSELARCCSDALNVIRGLKTKVTKQYIEEEKWLEKERDTWRLLFILFQDRLLSQNLMEEDAPIQYFGKSEKKCVENLFKRESLIRECQLVIDWLEAASCEKIDQNLHFSDTTIGWENTLHQLHSAETIVFASSRPIVENLDPDAPHYQNKPLHDLDVEDETSLNQKLFKEIRCGKLKEAQKLVRQCGHSWKAAIFEGWRLFHNPNINENYADIDKVSEDIDGGFDEMMESASSSIEMIELEGNSNRDIWKIMAIRYSKQEWINVYERASIATFSGNINALLPVCTTWEDYLWAYMKSMVDVRVESEIRDCCTKDGGYLPLPEDYWQQKMSVNEIFTSLESSKNKSVREESKEIERVMQKLLILDEIPILIKQLKEWSENSDVLTQFLRFIAHVVLFLNQIGQGNDRDNAEAIIEAYIKRLMKMQETQLVAFYISKLRPSSQIYLYAEYLENIMDQNERKIALVHGEESGLDILAITKQIVVNIRNRSDEVDQLGNLQKILTETDKFKISAIDWLIFHDTQRTELLSQSNAIIFNSLLLGKLDAAQLAFNKVPSDSVTRLTEEIGDSNEEMNLIVKEHLSYKVYLEAYEAFNEWFKQSKNKPNPPEELTETGQYSDKVAYNHRVSQYKAEIARWKLTTNHLGKTATTFLYNVLLFPDGWLKVEKDSDYLRKTILPEVTFLLYTVLFETELYDQCIHIADIIASEQYLLYKEFTEEQMEELLFKLKEASIHLLELNKDAFGYDLSD